MLCTHTIAKALRVKTHTKETNRNRSILSTVEISSLPIILGRYGNFFYPLTSLLILYCSNFIGCKVYSYRFISVLPCYNDFFQVDTGRKNRTISIWHPDLYNKDDFFYRKSCALLMFFVGRCLKLYDCLTCYRARNV